jgi:hypothetical protein
LGRFCSTWCGAFALGSPLDGSRNFALGFHAGSNIACGSAGKQVAKLPRHRDSQNLT